MTYKEALESVANSWASSTKHNTDIVSVPGNKPAVAKNATAAATGKHSTPRQPLPGTVLRISVPEGTALNFLDFVEVVSPGGMGLLVRFPFLSGLTPGGISLNSAFSGILNAIKAAGGTIEFLS